MPDHCYGNPRLPGVYQVEVKTQELQSSCWYVIHLSLSFCFLCKYLTVAVIVTSTHGDSAGIAVEKTD